MLAIIPFRDDDVFARQLAGSDNRWFFQRLARSGMVCNQRLVAPTVIVPFEF